jgi:hypothetical protein
MKKIVDLILKNIYNKCYGYENIKILVKISNLSYDYFGNLCRMNQMNLPTVKLISAENLNLIFKSNDKIKVRYINYLLVDRLVNSN